MWWRWWRDLTAHLKELAALVPVIVDVGLAGTRPLFRPGGSASDGGGCGGLGDDGERVIAERGRM